MSGDTASYLVRSLLSEGRIRYETVDKTADGLRARLVEREGPTGLIVTTTRDGLHPENETRLISLTLADGQDQTRAILKALANENRRDEVDREPWFALQQWIASSKVRVSVPFAAALVDLVPPVAVRLRRDVNLVLNLIRSHALLHMASRETDAHGSVLSTHDDYAAVYWLVADYLAEGVHASVPQTVRETVAEVERATREAGSATVMDVAKALKIDKSAASRRCQTAERRGYIRNEETSRGRPARYVPADPLPSEQGLLPHPDLLAAELTRVASGCTVAVQGEGYKPPPPSHVHKAPAERLRITL